MKEIRRGTGRAYSFPGGIAYGVGISMGITLTGTAFLTWMLNREIIVWEKIGYGIMVVLLLSAFLGALMANRKIKRQRMLVCVIEGATYLAALLTITALFFGGQYDGVGVTACLVAGGSCAAGVLGLRQGRGATSAKRRKLHR